MLDVSPDPVRARLLAAPQRVEPDHVVQRRWIPDFVARLIFGAPLAPSRAEWARMLAALHEGDPLMDELVAWMMEARERRALFERALLHGIDSDSPPALRRFFAHVDRVPPWLDRDLLAQGAQAAQWVGMAGFYVLRDMALMGGYVYFNSMNQTLAATGALSKNVALRLGETGKWLADAVAPEGLQRFGAGFVSTIRVRMVHALVRRSVKRDWAEERWGTPINQIDMMATYLAFGPVALSGARLFGVPITPAEGRAAMHMWRYIGWLLGVDERWLAVGELDGLRKLYHASLTHRLPDDKVRMFGEALRDEPLTRSIQGVTRPWLLRLVRRYQYAKHIANSALVLGPWQRYRLGVPMFALPWYVAISAPFRFVTLLWQRLRGERGRQAYLRRAKAEQEQLLASYLDDRPR